MKQIEKLKTVYSNYKTTYNIKDCTDITIKIKKRRLK